ncbi:MAG: hypothetical protein CL397_06420 [Acidiferrobacteraceae bacterium]|nr:hypothetical protein [Acidiferrobacteraceae bacterium]
MNSDSFFLFGASVPTLVLHMAPFVVVFVVGFIYVILRRLSVIQRMSLNAGIYGNVIVVLAGTYSIVLGFAIIVVWGFHGKQIEVQSKEVSALENIESLSRSFPIQIRREIQDDILTYVNLVQDVEWPLLDEGGQSEQAADVLRALLHVYTDMPGKERYSTIISQSLRDYNDVTHNRRLRIASSYYRVDTKLWLVLIIGGIVIILQSFFLDVKSGLFHWWLITVQTMVISLAISLVYELDHPYSGVVKIEPNQFSRILTGMQDLRH